MGKKNKTPPFSDNVRKKILNDFITGDDGYKIYWPEGFQGGGFSSWLLRLIADELDKANEDWDKHIQETFGG